jgi:hypothetical protein
MPAATALREYALATCGGKPLVELGWASGRLGANDCHFGRNGEVRLGFLETKLGPRMLDVKLRGGIVAETLWFEWQKAPASSPHSSALAKFLITFDEVGRNEVHDTPGDLSSPFHQVRLQTAPKSTHFAAQAKAGDDDLSGGRKYTNGAADKMMGSVPWKNGQVATGLQLGTRWSKVALEVTLVNSGCVHFHLDGMGDVEELLNKQGRYNFGVTARELRYVRRNWDRFKNHTIFYNGYKSGAGSPMMVAKPWN